MRKAILIFGFLLAVVSVQAQESAAAPEPAETRDTLPRYDGPHFAFTRTEYDFGSVKHSSPRIEHRFEFTNDGNEPLVITKTLSSCNCVKAQYDKKPVPPGGKGAITIIYEVNKKEAGVFYKIIEIYSNSVEKRKNLIIKGNAVK